MAYAAVEDLEKRFGSEIDQLLDRDGDASPDTGVFDAAAADADAIIDGYLASKYDLPLATVPPIVLQIACDIVRFLLWDDRAPEEVRKRYDDAINKLKDIAKGMIALAVSGVATPASGSSITTTTRTRSFTDSNLSSFVGD